MTTSVITHTLEATRDTPLGSNMASQMTSRMMITFHSAPSAGSQTYLHINFITETSIRIAELLGIIIACAKLVSLSKVGT